MERQRIYPYLLTSITTGLATFAVVEFLQHTEELAGASTSWVVLLLFIPLLTLIAAGIGLLFWWMATHEDQKDKRVFRN